MFSLQRHKSRMSRCVRHYISMKVATDTWLISSESFTLSSLKDIVWWDIVEGHSLVWGCGPVIRFLAYQVGVWHSIPYDGEKVALESTELMWHSQWTCHELQVTYFREEVQCHITSGSTWPL